jgi:hypothetical protein
VPFREPSQLRPSCQGALKPSDHHIGGQPDKQHERDGHRHILLWAAPEQERSSLRPERQTTLVLGGRRSGRALVVLVDAAPERSPM